MISDRTKETVGTGGIIRHAQKSYDHVRIKSLYAQNPYFVRTSRFERISRLRVKAVLYVRNKSLYAHKMYIVRTSRLERTSRIRMQ